MINQLKIIEMNEFTLDEAFSLIYKLAVLKNKEGSFPETPSVTQIGHICGLLTLNEQIEIVIKFHDEIKQFTKQEFLEEVKVKK